MGTDRGFQCRNQRSVMPMLAAICILTGLLACRGFPATNSSIPTVTVAIPANDSSADSVTNQPEICIHSLPKNAVVIIGSLDLSSSLHQVVIEARPAGTGEFTDRAAGPRVSQCNFPQPVVLLTKADQVHEFPATCRKNANSIDVASRNQELSRFDSVVHDEPDLSTVRHFLVPQFTDQGTQHTVRDAICIRQQHNVMVYCCSNLWSRIDIDQQQQLQRQATFICCELSNFTLPQIELLLGPVCDVDHNNHLTVLLTELDQRRQSQDVPVQGCVRESDLLDNQQPFGGDIIYLDQDVPHGSDLRALMIHETAHLAVYSAGLRHQLSAHRKASDDFTRMMPSWLNEAIAHTAERILAPDTENFARRMQLLAVSSGLCPVVMPTEGTSITTRRGGSRAAATLFVESLLNQPADLKRLLQFDVDPLPRLVQLGEKSFDDAFRDWSGYSLRQLTDCQRPEPTRSHTGEIHASLLLPLSNEMTQCNSLQGTAAQYFIAIEPVDCLRIHSSADAELQVTVLLPE